MIKVLICDDESFAVDNIKYALNKLNYTCDIVEFTSSLQARDYLMTTDEPLNIAFLDIQMPEVTGIDLAGIINSRFENTNIVFVTAYDDFALDAIHLRSSGYLLKPIILDDLKKEMENLRFPVTDQKVISISCFGNFQIFYDHIPVTFKYNKSNEVMAYLVLKEGALIKNNELVKALWDDDKEHGSYIRMIKKDILDTFSKLGCSDIFFKNSTGIGVNPSKVICDYYSWLENHDSVSYKGEFLEDYTFGHDVKEYINKEMGY